MPTRFSWGPALSALLLAGVLAAPAAQAGPGGLALDLDASGLSLPCGGCGSGAGTTVGWSFSTSQALLLGGLAAWDVDADGLGADTPVGLYTASGNLLASTTVADAGPMLASGSGLGGWRVAAISPLWLAPGDYLLGQVFFDALPLGHVQTSFSTDPRLSVTGGAFSANTDTGLDAPLNALPEAVFGPNLLLVPEPGSAPLLALALAVAIGLRKQARRRRALAGAAAALCASAWIAAPAAAQGCPNGSGDAQQFVQMAVPNLQAPGTTFTVKGKLSYPTVFDQPTRCIGSRKLPAVLILHGSSGVDSRGDFYQQALNAAGIVTLQIDMWEARGVTTLNNRPAAPILTYPDAFVALGLLASLPEVDATRVGVLGFSWGGVVSLATSERTYAAMFGGGRQFKAHVAHYPVCYGANNTSIPQLQPPVRAGTQYLLPTGAPVLIQIGSNDDYDNGAGHCQALAAQVNAASGNPMLMTVQVYPGAQHAWDRLMVPVTAADVFANEGSYFSTGVPPLVRITPSLAQAHQARARVVQFFKQKL